MKLSKNKMKKKLHAFLSSVTCFCLTFRYSIAGNLVLKFFNKICYDLHSLFFFCSHDNLLLGCWNIIIN